MTTTPIENLRENIRRVQARRKRIFIMRRLCLSLAVIVALFVGLVFIEAAFQLPITGRIALFSLLLGGACLLGIWLLYAGRQSRIDERRNSLDCDGAALLDCGSYAYVGARGIGDGP